jgi:hypothetical protein
MSYPPKPVASERRCTVTGHKDGGPCSIVVEELPGHSTVVLYPHGVESFGVALGEDEQRVLGEWLAARQRTSRRKP